MTDLILGPPGVLPPGDWCVGARVRDYTFCRPWVVVAPEEPEDGDGGMLLLGNPDGPPAPDASGVAYLERRYLRLDLTTGPIDAGTRALWSLLDLGEQPLTAPGWDRLAGMGWWLARGVAFIDPALSAHRISNRVLVPGICDDPRCALVLALAAVAEGRP